VIDESNYQTVKKKTRKQFARPEEWSKLQLDKVRWLTCIVERREEGALSIVPLLSNCRNVEELCVSVVVR
jgi:hypothetical protein